MIIMEQIQQIIKEKLPEAVGTELREFLNIAQSLEKENAELKKLKLALTTENDELRRIVNKDLELTARATIISKKEEELRIQEAILKVREEHAKQRVDEIRSLTQTVFGSNRMNYNLDLNLPNPLYNGTQYNSTLMASGTIRGDN